MNSGKRRGSKWARVIQTSVLVCCWETENSSGLLPLDISGFPRSNGSAERSSIRFKSKFLERIKIKALKLSTEMSPHCIFHAVFQYLPYMKARAVWRPSNSQLGGTWAWTKCEHSPTFFIYRAEIQHFHRTKKIHGLGIHMCSHSCGLVSPQSCISSDSENGTEVTIVICALKWL